MCSTITVLASLPSGMKTMKGGRKDELGGGSMSGVRRLSSIAMTTNGSTTTLRQMESSVVEYKGVKFLITERPSEKTMDAFLTEVLQHKASYIVRVGGEPYETDRIQEQGVQVVDLPFADGTAPSVDIIAAWCQLLRSKRADQPSFCVTVHCVAGLGRAPVLVAIALIELGMRYEDAVEFIRQRRKGAINAKQLDFLSKYRPKSRLSVKKKACLIM